MDRECLDRAFDALSRAARLSGVYRTVARALRKTLERPDPADGRRPVAVLDVGAGRGDLLRHLEEALGSIGVDMRPFGGELHPTALRLAGERGPPVRLVRLSAPRLPFEDDSVDFVVSTITLHHLERPDAVRFLADAHRVARRGWMVVDLRRALTTRLAVGLLAATLWRGNPLPRHDGPVSVRRAFRAGEARQLLGRAGLSGARVRRRPLLHLTIAGGELARGGGRVL